MNIENLKLGSRYSVEQVNDTQFTGVMARKDTMGQAQFICEATGTPIWVHVRSSKIEEAKPHHVPLSYSERERLFYSGAFGRKGMIGEGAVAFRIAIAKVMAGKPVNPICRQYGRGLTPQKGAIKALRVVEALGLGVEWNTDKEAAYNHTDAFSVAFHPLDDRRFNAETIEWQVRAFANEKDRKAKNLG